MFKCASLSRDLDAIENLWHDVKIAAEPVQLEGAGTVLLDYIHLHHFLFFWFFLSLHQFNYLCI